MYIMYTRVREGKAHRQWKSVALRGMVALRNPFFVVHLHLLWFENSLLSIVSLISTIHRKIQRTRKGQVRPRKRCRNEDNAQKERIQIFELMYACEAEMLKESGKRIRGMQ